MDNGGNKVARLPCAEFSRWLRAVLGAREPDTTVPERVRHPSAFTLEHEGPCRGAVRCASRQAWMELRQVLRSYQLVLPLRVTALATGGSRYLLVEVA